MLLSPIRNDCTSSMAYMACIPAPRTAHFSAHSVLGLDLYDFWGRAGLIVQRRVTDNDAYYAWAARNGGAQNKHDVSFDFGGSALVFRGDFELEAGLVYTRQLNRNFFGDKVNNFNLNLGVHWRPGVR